MNEMHFVKPITSAMSLFTCTLSLMTIKDIRCYIFIPLWLVGVISVCIVSIRFIYLIIKKQPKLAKNGKKRLNALMIATSLTISIGTIALFFMKLYTLHTNYPIPDYDYSRLNDCNMTKVSLWSETLFQIVNLMILNGLILTIVVYYYRLILIFEGSFLRLSSKQRYIVYFVIVEICITNMTCFIITLLFGRSNIVKMLGFISFLIYILTSIYLCYLLRKQMLLLIEQLNNAQHCQKALYFYNIMKKFTILTYFSVLSTVFTFTLSMILEITGYSIITKYIQALMVIIDTNTTLICMVIQFSFGDVIYNPICKRFEKISMFSADNRTNVAANENTARTIDATARIKSSDH